MPEAGAALRGRDQAAGLRQLFAPRGARLLPVLVPEPRITRRGAALACWMRALAAAGERTLVLDAARQNLAHELGLRARYDLFHGLSGERSLTEVLLPAGARLRVAPAARAVEAAQTHRVALRETLVHAAAGADLVVLIIDAARASELGNAALLLAGTSAQEVAAAAGALRARTAALGLVFADAREDAIADLCARLGAAGAEVPPRLGGLADAADAARIASLAAGWELAPLNAQPRRNKTTELRQ